MAATAGDFEWAPWRRLGLGWRFWSGLGTWCGVLALVCLAIYPLKLFLRRWSGVEEKRDTKWCVSLCVVTTVLATFVPAIAAL